mgnify:CR=1 FL=1
MTLHLFIPSLFWPDSSQTDIYNELSLPSLEIILAKSVSTKNPSQEIDAWLCHTFGITKQQNWPVAPIMLQLDGSGKVETGKDYWIRADPVHLRLEQNHIMLADSQAFQITKEEAEQFTNKLNHNLSNNGLVLLPLQPDRWYIRTTNTPAIRTHTLNKVTCENINNFLPSGEEGITWNKIFNETQMLLHEDPLNQAREARGELAINSIWFWGGGIMPQSVESPYTHIWSNDDFPRALAIASDTQHLRLPSNATIWQQSAAPGNHLVVLDALHVKAKYKDAYGWRLYMKELEQNWFQPLHKALQKGNIDQLTITTNNESACLNFTISHSDLWKFWLTKKPITSFIMA